MNQRFIFTIAFYLLGLVAFTSPSIACLMDAPQVQQKDIVFAPDNMIAFKASIIEPILNASLFSVKPHNGFTLNLKITKVYQGKIKAGDSITVDYGACHNLPDTSEGFIRVLALKKEDGWYAPQFWHLKSVSLEKDGAK